MAAAQWIRERARERSREVCRLLASGKSIAEVAGILRLGSKQRVHQLLRLTCPAGVTALRPKLGSRCKGKEAA